MKTLLIYYSKTGFTRKYARWLAEDTGCDLVAFSPSMTVDSSCYDAVIFASWFHAGTIQKLEWLKKQKLQQIKKIVLVTGAAPAGAPSVEKDIQKNFADNEGHYKVFYLPAGLCYEKMGLGDKLMMKMFSKMLSGKKTSDPFEAAMKENIGSSFDNSSREYLKPVITYLTETL